MPFAMSVYFIGTEGEERLLMGEDVAAALREILARASGHEALFSDGENNLSPFTVSPLRRHKESEKSCRYRWRLTALTMESGAALLQGLSTLLQAEESLHFGSLAYTPDRAMGFVQPERECSYARLLTAPPAAQADLQALSPTVAWLGRQSCPLPLAGPLLRLLGEKWNAFSDVEPLPEEALRALAETVTLTRGEIRAACWPGQNRAITGFVGRFRWAVGDSSEELRQVFATLVAYAEFAGLGTHVTLGFGQTRLLALHPIYFS